MAPLLTRQRRESFAFLGAVRVGRPIYPAKTLHKTVACSMGLIIGWSARTVLGVFSLRTSLDARCCETVTCTLRVCYALGRVVLELVPGPRKHLVGQGFERHRTFREHLFDAPKRVVGLVSARWVPPS